MPFLVPEGNSHGFTTTETREAGLLLELSGRTAGRGHTGTVPAHRAQPITPSSAASPAHHTQLCRAARSGREALLPCGLPRDPEPCPASSSPHSWQQSQLAPLSPMGAEGLLGGPLSPPAPAPVERASLQAEQPRLPRGGSTPCTAARAERGPHSPAWERGAVGAEGWPHCPRSPGRADGAGEAGRRQDGAAEVTLWLWAAVAPQSPAPAPATRAAPAAPPQARPRLCLPGLVWC